MKLAHMFQQVDTNDAITGSVPQEIIDGEEDFMQTLETSGSDLVRLTFDYIFYLIIKMELLGLYIKKAFSSPWLW